jgi:molybdenum cofactor biosynthesis enzyme MoaA
VTEPQAHHGPAQAAHHVLALMVTRRCNMTCAHCSVESSPSAGGADPDEAELVRWIHEAAAAGVRTIRITGGEPMLRAPLVLRLVRECVRAGLAPALVTNGFWGYNPVRARRYVRALQRAGLTHLTVSYDQYHAEFQGPAPGLHIAAAAEALQLTFNFNVVRGSEPQLLTEVAGTLEPARGSRMRVYELQLVGRARTLDRAAISSEADGFCTSCSYPMVAEDGRVIACTGPAFFEAADSPLVIGSARTERLDDLLRRHFSDPVLNVIRTRGPAGLRDELRRTPGFESFPFRDRYVGICELCHHITRDAAAVAALRSRLSTSSALATQVAAWQVIDGNRRRGELTAQHVNGVGACRVFLRAAQGDRDVFARDGGHLLGHAHMDWRVVADFLAGSGLARPLMPVLDEPALTRWAPGFFVADLKRRGLRDALREAVQRSALERIEDALVELGGRGVLLKGTALLALAPRDAVARATSDIDVYVEPRLASRLRTTLLQRGFTGDPDAGPSSQHHLEPVLFQGVPIEIHTRLMPASWKLPEGEMLECARPIPGTRALWAMPPEAMALHAVVHLSASFFSFGLKTAWDLLALCADPGFDWERLGRWAAALGTPRAFWTPLRVLAAELGLPVPAMFLSQAPLDPGARRLEIVASRRLFRAVEGQFDLDALTKTGMTLLVHDRWTGRARYLLEQTFWRGTRPATWGAAAQRATRAGLFRQSWSQYKRYRRAVAAYPASAASSSTSRASAGSGAVAGSMGASASSASARKA